MVLGVRRPRHHGVQDRPVAVAEGARRAVGYRHRRRHRHPHPARGPPAAVVLGLLHRLPVLGAPGRGRQPVVLGPHPALLHPRRGRPPRAAGLDPGLGGAHRRALRRAHRAGRRRTRQPHPHDGHRAVLRRAEHHRRRTPSPKLPPRAAAPGRGEGPRHRRTGNGTGWSGTASSPNSPWTTTPPRGRYADR